MKSPSLDHRLRWALAEDAADHDVTTRQIPNFASKTAAAVFQSKAKGIFCGEDLLRRVYRLVSPRIKTKILVKDGAPLRIGQPIAKVRGPIGAILAGERLALNLIGHASGIATLTRRYVDAVRGTNARILDTRKTTPLWRDVEKHAVVCGGGMNHRFSLGDAVLVKDNHAAYLAHEKISLASVFSRRPKQKNGQPVEFVAIEATTVTGAWRAIQAQADVVLLDNMAVKHIKESLALIRATRAALGTEKPLVECSGGMTIEKTRRVARLGVDRISVGALTHSAPVLDISLEVVE